MEDGVVLKSRGHWGPEERRAAAEGIREYLIQHHGEAMLCGGRVQIEAYTQTEHSSVSPLAQSALKPIATLNRDEATLVCGFVHGCGRNQRDCYAGRALVQVIQLVPIIGRSACDIG